MGRTCFISSSDLFMYYLDLFKKETLCCGSTLSLTCEANKSALLMIRGTIKRTQIASWSPINNYKYFFFHFRHINFIIGIYII